MLKMTQERQPNQGVYNVAEMHNHHDDVVWWTESMNDNNIALLEA